MTHSRIADDYETIEITHMIMARTLQHSNIALHCGTKQRTIAIF